MWPCPKISSTSIIFLHTLYGKVIYLKKLVRQSVIILGEIVPLEIFPETSCLTSLNSNCKTYCQFSRRKKMLARLFFVQYFCWWLLPFLVNISFFGLSMYCIVQWIPLATTFPRFFPALPHSNFHDVCVCFRIICLTNTFDLPIAANRDKGKRLTVLAVFLFMVSLCICGNNVLSNTCHISSLSILLFCYSQFASFITLISEHSFKLFLLTCFFINRNEKVYCEDCGTQTTGLNLARHKKRCTSLTSCSCTNFSTESRAEMKYYFAKKHSKATASVVSSWKKCDKYFHSFYNLREHKRKEHGSQRISGAQNVGVADVMGDVDDNSLKENNWKRANTSWLTVRWILGDTESPTLPWILWIQ